MDQTALLALSGFAAGAMNALAGGGSFVTFPALLLAGLPSVVANASSAVALFPASLASAFVYRSAGFGLSSALPTGSIHRLLATSLAGGMVGAVLLLATPTVIFDRIVPFVLLLATLALVFGPRVAAASHPIMRIGLMRIAGAPLIAGQFLLGIYGGYFGGAVGIMMMAVWSLFGAGDLKAMNPAKTLLVAATNAVAVLCFIAAGAVWWAPTAVVLVAAVVGGYAGARLGRCLSPGIIRTMVTLTTAAMTVAFVLRSLGWAFPGLR
jgi:uncharacterized membrane protein YfcA